MGLTQSFAISRSGLQAERLRMDVVANNLANANSTRSADGGPYQREVVLLRAQDAPPSFSGALAQALSGNAPGGVAVDSVTTDPAPPRRVYEPTNPDAGPDGYVLYPNIDTTVEMTDMVSAGRSYEANVTALNAAKTMAEKALEILH